MLLPTLPTRVAEVWCQQWAKRGASILDNHHMACRAGDPIAEWIETNVPDAGAVTGTSSLGSSGWSSFQKVQTASGQSFFVKQARGRGAEAMFKGEALGLRAMYGARPAHGSPGSGRLWPVTTCAGSCSSTGLESGSGSLLSLRRLWPSCCLSRITAARCCGAGRAMCHAARVLCVRRQRRAWRPPVAGGDALRINRLYHRISRPWQPFCLMFDWRGVRRYSHLPNTESVPLRLAVIGSWRWGPSARPL